MDYFWNDENLSYVSIETSWNKDKEVIKVNLTI